MNRKEIDVAGRVLIELGQPPAPAEPLLSRAIGEYTAEHVREVAHYEAWLAEAFARSGELDAARATVRHARQASASVNSARLERRVGMVERMIGA
ncbi:hypothetical protein [Amycolatopsis sp. 3B14]|uniref:hypothetical protein n=1 Tax=Amycolatopsis sp. 3B14 TaxID=3243600 RepID=UPI003D98ABBE